MSQTYASMYDNNGLYEVHFGGSLHFDASLCLKSGNKGRNRDFQAWCDK